MSKLIMWNMMSLDGFFEGPQSWSIDWFAGSFDEELQSFALEQLRGTERLLFGRVTYEGMAVYWASERGDVADFMNRLPKVVFSRTLARAEWQNTELVSGDAIAAVRELKRSGEGNIFVYGSADLSAALTEGGLFDEYRICIVPVVLGTGKALFAHSPTRLKLKLLQARALASGCVILRYEPQRI